MRQVRDGEAVQGASGIWAAADSPAVRVDGAGRHPPPFKFQQYPVQSGDGVHSHVCPEPCGTACNKIHWNDK